MSFPARVTIRTVYRRGLLIFLDIPVATRTRIRQLSLAPTYPLRRWKCLMSHQLPPLTDRHSKQAFPTPSPFSTTYHLRSFASSPGGRGRSRKHKRQRPRANAPAAADTKALQQKPSTSNARQSKAKDQNISGSKVETEDALPYPKGQPWRVLWPQPHGNAALQAEKEKQKRRIPRLADFSRAWALYKKTWEDGISGRPSAAKLERLQREELARQLAEAEADLETSKASLDQDSMSLSEREKQLRHIEDNAARNIQLIRKDAQALLEQAKEKTGIHTQDDVKAVASQMMQVATECIQEFMAGYRQGRDQEIDKMLNEYFKEENEDGANDGAAAKETAEADTEETKPQRRKRRKPKRGIPRD